MKLTTTIRESSKLYAKKMFIIDVLSLIWVPIVADLYSKMLIREIEVF